MSLFHVLREILIENWHEGQKNKQQEWKKVKGTERRQTWKKERDRKKNRGLYDSVTREKRTPLKNKDTLSVSTCPCFTSESNKRRSIGEITFLERPWKRKKASVYTSRLLSSWERKTVEGGRRVEKKRDKLSWNRSRSVDQTRGKKVFLVE